MRESKLYEDLLKIDAKMMVSLKNNPFKSGESPCIQIIGVGNLSNETLDKIMAASKKHRADMELTSIGVIEIKFKEDINDEKSV